MTAIPRTLVARATGTDPATLPEGDLPLDRFAARHAAFLGHAEGEAHPDAWTYAVMDELTDSHPDLALAALRETLARCDTPEQVARLAAGPLEDLLVRHGASVIGPLADQADARMLYALTGVWRNDIPAMVWARIEALRRDVPALDDDAPLPPA